VNKRLERAIQIGIPALQQYHRDLTNVAPLPKPYQVWMCPSCETIHTNEPYETEEYICVTRISGIGDHLLTSGEHPNDYCNWHGNRQDLLCANKKTWNYV